MGKKLLSILMSVALLFGSFGMAFATDVVTTSATSEASYFPDMPDNWSTAALNKAVDNGLLSGYVEGGKKLIKAGNSLTRAEMAAVINRAFASEKTTDLSKVSDVSAKAWYAKDVAKAVKMGTFAYSTKMRPGDKITRQEAFIVLARAFKLVGTDAKHKALNAFSDKGEIATWALNSLDGMAAAGYIQGSGGKLNPTANITRAEFAVVMDNLVKDYIDVAGDVTKVVVKGNVIVRVAGVTLKDVTVKGDLIIADGVGDGDVTLDNVKVEGRTVVRGGGENSIIVKGGSELGRVIVAKVDGVVRVFAEDGAEIEVIYVDDGSDDVIVEGTFGELEVAGNDVTVHATGSEINNATVSGDNSRIIVGDGSKVKNGSITGDSSAIIVDEGGSVDTVTINGSNASVGGDGEVKSVEVKEGGDGTSIDTPNTKTVVDKGVEGVEAGGAPVGGGQTATNNATGTGATVVNTPPPTRPSRPSRPVVDEGDTTQLEADILAAQTLCNNATEGTDPGQYATDSKATLQAAIDTAQAVVDRTAPKATAAEITAAKGALAAAVAAFETGKVPKNAGPEAPAAPELSAKTDTSVTLKANPLHEFSNDNGTTWQDSEVFTGLTAATEYTFVARVKETATHEASAASSGTTITTNVAPLGGTVSITGDAKFGETLTADISDLTNAGTPTYQWARDGATIAGATNSTYVLVADDIGKVITVTVTADEVAGTGSATSDGTAAVAKTDGPASPTVVGSTSDAENEILIVVGDAKITVTIGTNMKDAYEYSVNDGADWTDLSAGDIAWSPLDPASIQIRIKATATHEAGDIATLDIHKVTFDVSGTADQFVASGGKAVEPTVPAYDNEHYFRGWYEDHAWEMPFNFNTPITKFTQLYAKWEPALDAFFMVFDAFPHEINFGLFEIYHPPGSGDGEEVPKEIEGVKITDFTLTRDGNEVEGISLDSTGAGSHDYKILPPTSSEFELGKEYILEFHKYPYKPGTATFEIKSIKARLDNAYRKINGIGNDKEQWIPDLGLEETVWGNNGTLTKAAIVLDDDNATLEEINDALDALLLTAFKAVKKWYLVTVLEAITDAYDLHQYQNLESEQKDEVEVFSFIWTEKTANLKYGLDEGDLKLTEINITSIEAVHSIIDEGIENYLNLLTGINESQDESGVSDALGDFMKKLFEVYGNAAGELLAVPGANKWLAIGILGEYALDNIDFVKPTTDGNGYELVDESITKIFALKGEGYNTFLEIAVAARLPIDKEKLGDAITAIEALENRTELWWGDDGGINFYDQLFEGSKSEFYEANKVYNDPDAFQIDVDDALDDLIAAAFRAAKQKDGLFEVVPIMADAWDLTSFNSLTSDQKCTSEAISFINMAKTAKITLANEEPEKPTNVSEDFYDADKIKELINDSIDFYLEILDGINEAENVGNVETKLNDFIDYVFTVYPVVYGDAFGDTNWEKALKGAPAIQYFAESDKGGDDFKLIDGVALKVFNGKNGGYLTLEAVITAATTSP